jgi:uncharacterized membrane protein (DUF373 family)
MPMLMAEQDSDAPRWPWVVRAMTSAEDVMHVAVAVVLAVVAGYVLVHTVGDFSKSDVTFSARVTGAINGVLIVVIVLEILRTVIGHFEHEGFQLKPFLIIGIISAVRHILTVGAQQSLGVRSDDSSFTRAQIELGVNAGVVIALVVGLVLVHATGSGKESRGAQVPQTGVDEGTGSPA